VADLDLGAVVKRLAEARVAHAAVMNLANAPNSARFDAAVRAVLADVPPLIAEVDGLRRTIRGISYAREADRG
jgi:hypothetical protein